MESRGASNFNQSNTKFKNVMSSTSSDYGQEWLVSDAKTLHELGENEIKLRYLEKSYKSKRRIEQINSQKSQEIDQEVNEKYKYDKNAIVCKKFPFKADEFKYPNDEDTKPKTLYIKYNDEYGSKKPNDLELPEKFFPINNTFTKDFSHNMYKNNSLNTAATRSKVHTKLDSII